MRECRLGRHALTAPTPVGGGIFRRVCSECGHVTINLTSATIDAARLRRRRRSQLGTTRGRSPRNPVVGAMQPPRPPPLILSPFNERNIN